MKTLNKRLLTLLVLLGAVSFAFADRGVGRRVRSSKTAYVNIATNSSLKNSIGFNLKTGLVYKGSILDTKTFDKSAIINNSLVTYEKGNTTYIIPYKHKIIMPDMRQGYGGVKIILQRRK